MILYCLKINFPRNHHFKIHDNKIILCRNVFQIVTNQHVLNERTEFLGRIRELQFYLHSTYIEINRIMPKLMN